MKCRNIVKDTNGKQTIVWFGSIGMKYYERQNTGTSISQSFDRNIFIVNNNELTLKFETLIDTNNNVENIDAMFNFRLVLRNGTTAFYNTSILHLKNKVLSKIEKVIDMTSAYENFDFVGYEISINTSPTPEVIIADMYLKTYSNEKLPAEEYVDKQQGVASSSIQRLSIIKGELWYNIQEGLPLFDKDITITSMDAYVIRTIMNQPDVINIASFNSKVEEHAYHCNVDVISKYGTFSLTV